MSSHRRVRGSLVASALACLMAATGLGSAHSQEPVSVRLNWFAAGYTAPFYLGVDKGWYKEVGLDVTIQEGQGSGPTGQQVAAGGSTFGFISADALIRLVSQGAPIKMIASLAATNGYCVLVKADAGINTAKDLEGKRYGSTAASSVARMLPAYLKASNVSPDKVERISVDYANLYAGFLGDQFQAMEAFSFDEPPRFDARGQKTKCLSYADAGIKILGSGIVTNLTTLQSKPDMVRKFVAVTLRAYDASFKDPEQAAEAAKKLAGESVQNTSVSVAQLRLFEKLQGKPYGRIKSEDMESSVSLVKEYLQIANAPTDMSKLFTNEFLP